MLITMFRDLGNMSASTPDNDLADHFQTYFRILPADSPPLREQVFRIRYDVYCREFGFEKEECFPDGLEKDDYDDQAHHCIIIHRASGQGAGCVRLVTASPNDSEFLLPMERCCAQSLKDPARDPRRLPRDRIAEVSRLAVHTGFRRRSGETASPAGRVDLSDISAEQRRTFPLLSLALFYASAALMQIRDRQHAFVMVEPRLARRLQALALPITQVGEPLEYHGTRAGFYLQAQAVVDNIPNELKGLYQYAHRSLSTGLPDSDDAPTDH